MAVYGVQLGVRAPAHGPWEPADRKAELRRSRHAGIVAAAVVAWRGLSIPDKVEYAGPSYDAATGKFRLGEGAGGEVFTGT